ncbi:MAG: DUF924 domain-containing protein [Alphaproteobacteria bacterium]|nr:DUF924 domain-containing protein [Alphaproteobacteria bacterium]
MKDFQKEIIDFWFVETQPQQWFQVNAEFDARVKERFLDFYQNASQGTYDEWQKSADGALALCILLDQMPRNMFRGTPQAFETDKKALVIAKFALSKGLDQVLSPQKRRFLYLPFEHSENLNDQRRCVELFEKMKDDDPLGYDYALRHLKVIEEFGRFPHRNKILGRDNTPEEEAYLAQPDAGF